MKHVLKSDIKRYSEYFEDYMRKRLKKYVDLYSYEPVAYALEGGKRVRPLIMMFSSESVGGDWRDVLPASLAIELLHTGSLVHDDIIDSDETRRGREAVHIRFGHGVAIVISDFTLALILDMSSEFKREVLRIIASAAIDMCQGEIMDVLGSGESKVDEDYYLRMIELKTASLFKSSAEIGAVIGGGKAEEVRALAEYAKSMGMAYQLRDDELGLTGDQELGKPIYSDLMNRRHTLATIHAINNLNGEESDRLQAYLRGGGGFSEAVTLLGKSGALDHIHRKAEWYAREAKKALVPLRDSKAKDILMNLANYMIIRES